MQKDSLEFKDEQNNPKEHIDHMEEGQSHIDYDTGQSLIPVLLNFIKSIVNSDDPPLNISRKTLQQNQYLRVDKKNLVKKSLEMPAGNAEVKDEYKMYYEQSDEKLSNMNSNLVESIFLTAPGFSHFYRCLTKHNYGQQKNMIVATLAQALKMPKKVKLNNKNQAG